MAYLSSRGQALIDRRLYLPKSWSSSPEKRQKAKITQKTKFATKTGLAKEMLQSAFKKGLRPSAYGNWFVADEVYSRDGLFWYWLEQTFQQSYVLQQFSVG